MRYRVLELGLAGLLFAIACKREERDLTPLVPAIEPPAGGKGPYDENAFGVSEGKRLFRKLGTLLAPAGVKGGGPGDSQLSSLNHELSV